MQPNPEPKVICAMAMIWTTSLLLRCFISSVWVHCTIPQCATAPSWTIWLVQWHFCGWSWWKIWALQSNLSQKSAVLGPSGSPHCCCTASFPLYGSIEQSHNVLPLIHGPSGWFSVTFLDGADKKSVVHLKQSKVNGHHYSLSGYLITLISNANIQYNWNINQY